MSKARKLKLKKLLLQVLSFVFSIAPLAAVFFKNSERYVSSVTDAVKLSLGVILIIVFVALKAAGKLKIPRRITGYAIAFGLCYLLANVLPDLLLITGAALVGEVIDVLIFTPWIARVEKKILIEETADATAGKVEEILQQYVGGRV
jgi:chromate transport protein ChrA